MDDVLYVLEAEDPVDTLHCQSHLIVPQAFLKYRVFRHDRRWSFKKFLHKELLFSHLP